MNFRSIVLFAAVLGASFAGTAARAELPSGYKVHDLSAVYAVAEKEQKKVLVVYTQIRCPPCRFVMGALSRDDVRAAYQDKFVFAEVSLDAPGGRALFKQHGVRFTPTFAFQTSSQEVVCHSGGFDNAHQGIALAKAVLATDKPLTGPIATRRCSTLMPGHAGTSDNAPTPVQ